MFMAELGFLQRPYKKEWPNGTVQNLSGYEKNNTHKLTKKTPGLHYLSELNEFISYSTKK